MLESLAKAREVRAAKFAARQDLPLAVLVAEQPDSPSAERIARQDFSPPEVPIETPQTLEELGILPASEPEPDINEYVLSDEERLRIEEEAAAFIRAERKARVIKAHKEQALQDARRRSGDIPPDEERRLELGSRATLRINLPRLRLTTGGTSQPDPIIIDQKVYHHGRTYEVSIAEAEYIMDRMCQRWMHSAQVDGQSRTYYNEQMSAMVHQGGRARGFVGEMWAV